MLTIESVEDLVSSYFHAARSEFVRVVKKCFIIRAVRTTKLMQLDFGQDSVIEKSVACLQEVVKVITELQENSAVKLAIKDSDFKAD